MSDQTPSADEQPAIDDLVQRYPLPSGVKDEDCNQETMALRLNTSVPTLTKWIKTEGLPVIEGGGPGRPYVLRLSQCWAWAENRKAAEEERKAFHARQQTALQAHFLNMDVDQPEMGLDSTERKKLAEASIMWMKAAHMRQQLVHYEEVADDVAELFEYIRNAVEGLSDELESRLDLSPVQIRVVRDLCRQTLTATSEMIEAKMIEPHAVADVTPQKQWMV